jgi:hypothetical protein
MALQKQEISVDLVQGADTKTNDQIDTGFKEMENIVFSKELTAKKIGGVVQLAILPDNTNAQPDPSNVYSVISKCGPDLIALSDKGVYKKIDSDDNMSFINSMGSLGMNLEVVPGEHFAIGTTRKMVVDVSDPNYYTFFTYQLDGVLIEKSIFEHQYSTEAVHKLISIGDDFYFLGIGQVGSANPNNLTMYKNGVQASALDLLMGNTDKVLIDMITDGTDVFVSWSIDDTTSTNVLWKVDTASYTFLMNTVALATKGNINLTNKDATTIWATYAIASTPNLTIRQAIITKTTMAISSVLSIGVIPMYDPANTNNPRITATAYTDSLAMFIVFEVISTQTFGTIGHVRQSNMSIATQAVGLQGKGKPFLMGGFWYAPVKMSLGNKEITVLIREGKLGSQDEAISPAMVTLPSQFSKLISTFPTSPNRAFGESYSVGEFYYFSSNSSDKSAIIKTSVDPHEINGAIEIGGNLVTFGSIAGYFDGIEFAELGFIGQPYMDAGAVAGSLPADTYQAVAIYRWTDAKGNIFRSSESNTASLALAGTQNLALTIYHPLITKKDRVYVEIYVRKTNNVFQLYASYLVAGSTLYKESIVISSYPAPTAPILYTEPTARENSTPLNAICMTLYGDRLFYISADDRDMVRYTKQKQENIGFEFVQDFRQQVLDKRGYNEDKLNSLMAMDGRLLIFKEQSILFIYGIGPANDGSQNDYSDPQIVSSDVGCISQRSLILMPNGIMFKSQKGIYLVSRKLEVVYIGAPVEKFNNLTISSAVMLDDDNEIRFTTLEGTTLIYNYLSAQWSWVVNMPSRHSTIFKDVHTTIRNDLIVQEDRSTYKLLGAFVAQKISSPWMRLKDIQHYQKAYTLDILGFYKTPHQMSVQVYYDYELYASESYQIDPLSEDQYNIVDRPTNAEIESGAKTNGVYQLRIDLVRKNCQAIRVVISDIEQDLDNNNGECFSLSNLTFTIGLKSGTNKLPASKLY